jgi:hypothetical protein
MKKQLIPLLVFLFVAFLVGIAIYNFLGNTKHTEIIADTSNPDIEDDDVFEDAIEYPDDTI